MDNNNISLSIQLIHYIFDTYFGIDFKMLIHKEGSTDEDISKKLSIELILISRMENYFKNVLLSDKFKKELCNIASEKGYLNTLKWAREHRCEWDSDTCSAAAENGHLNCIQWAVENGCDWNSNTCSYAAANGHLNCLIWAREHGCPWDSYTCSSAASNGHLNCLQWAHKHGCEWNICICWFAAANGHLNILQWAREHGCPSNRNNCLLQAKYNKHENVVNWINEQINK